MTGARGGAFWSDAKKKHAQKKWTSRKKNLHERALRWEWTSPEMSSTLPPLFLLHTSAVCLSAPPLPQPSTPQVGY
ncbi:MAG: hypothetical protein DUD35_14145 [Lactobacillus sp.]|nr:MAG: hypothetical protein DUD35_14145 [Lactobacillus sp.]